MRNLKKFLALVLAMLMSFSLMVTVNAASDFTDVDTITDEFSEGVAVLEGLGVFEGYPDKTFKPKNSITRAEVATIVYRLATGDTKGVQAHLYADYQKFDDVKSDHWAAGYINYCANAEWIAGYGNGKFGPGDSVTGYQAAAMILRAVGYGKNNEFTGSGWQVQVANFTRSLGLLTNVDNTTYANTLNSAATRELIAEILFQAGLIPTVNWTMLLGYQPTGRGSLSQINFDLKVGGWTEIDKWGNPGYYWYKTTNTAANRVATIEAVPDMEFTDTKYECDIAHELDFEPSQSFVLYVNDKTEATTNYLVVATDTTTKVGGQGRLTKVYDTLVHPYTDLLAAGEPYEQKSTVTMVDTFLAQVTQVAEARLDAAGHVITPARLTLNVYDQPQTTAKTPNPSQTVVSKASTDATNWEYSVGDMILLNAQTTHTAGITANGGANDHTTNETTKNQAAFEAEQVPATLNNTSSTVLGKADSRVAKQTTVYWNQGKHNVDGTDIPDQIDLFLDVAGTTTNSDYTWYFDQYDNIIGIGEAIQSNFGVITSLYSSFNTADGATNGESVAKAHVKYADGTEGDVIIAQFVVYSAVLADGHATPSTANGMRQGARSTELVPVYDYSTNSTTGNTMQAVTAMTGYTPVNPVSLSGRLNVSPVASINANLDTNTNPYFGIIKDNLFKFVTAGNGKVSAIEVAGTDQATNSNDTIYVNHFNSTFATDANANAPTTAEIAARTLYKNGGYLSVNTPATTIRLDNNTQIMVLNDTTKDIATYNGLSALPGNIICKSGSEVDWADYDGDGIAEVVYVTGENAGSTAYGLFYYAGGAGQWNDTDKKGTLAGYLGGEAKTLTFTNKAEYDLVRGSNAYGGHLFAVRLNGDEVTSLLGRNGYTTNAAYITSNDGTLTPATSVTLSTDLELGTVANGALGSLSTNDDFVCGVLGGNGYTAALTKADWVVDSGANVTWNQYTNQIMINGSATYSLTGASKIVGDLAYLNAANRTNDITIVYEDNAVNSIVEVYVTTMPDNTPGTGAVRATAPTGAAVNSVGTSVANLETALNSGVGNQVVYCSDSATTSLTSYTVLDALGLNLGTSGGASDLNHLDDYLFFPFTLNATATNGAAATLVIKQGDTVVYTENASFTSGAPHRFVVNFAGNADNASGVPSGRLTLLSGVTYTFEITASVSTGAVWTASSGTFTMA